MLKRIGKRGVVIAAIFVLVCGAVFLNWKYTNGLSDDYVKAEDALKTGAQTDPSSQEGEQGTSGSGAYFATARLTRQQARDSALALLQEAAKEEEADEKTHSQVAESIQTLATYTLQEAQIENMVTAKGYVDCVAFLTDSGISVVVETESGELNQTDIARILDTVKSEVDFGADQIKIMAAK